MEKEPKPGTCSTCAYWKHTPDAPVNGPSSISKGHVKGQLTRVETGLCYFEQPKMMPLPSALGQIQMQRVFPHMLENEFCSHHPTRVLDREMALAAARQKAGTHIVEFSPDKHGDAHAGFNTPPDLAAAKKAAIVMQQCESKSREGVQCTEVKGHFGVHVAGVNREQTAWV